MVGNVFLSDVVYVTRSVSIDNLQQHDGNNAKNEKESILPSAVTPIGRHQFVCSDINHQSRRGTHQHGHDLPGNLDEQIAGGNVSRHDGQQPDPRVNVKMQGSFCFQACLCAGANTIDIFQKMQGRKK
jgi:hypothetical protein